MPCYLFVLYAWRSCCRREERVQSTRVLYGAHAYWYARTHYTQRGERVSSRPWPNEEMRRRLFVLFNSLRFSSSSTSSSSAHTNTLRVCMCVSPSRVATCRGVYGLQRASSEKRRRFLEKCDANALPSCRRNNTLSDFTRNDFVEMTF